MSSTAPQADGPRWQHAAFDHDLFKVAIGKERQGSLRNCWHYFSEQKAKTISDSVLALLAQCVSTLFIQLFRGNLHEVSD